MFTFARNECSSSPEYAHDWEKAIDEALKNGDGGVYYLTQLPYKFSVKFDSSHQSPQLPIVYLPNMSPLFSLDIVRKPFVENSTTVTFSNGTLQSVNWTKPSEVLGLLDIPVDIAKVLMGIPGELLTLKINNLKNDANLLNAQKEYLQAQMDLISKQAELDQLKQE